MNILLLVHGLYGGGAEHAAADIARFLSKENTVHLVLLEEPGEASYDLPPGVHLHVLSRHSTFLRRLIGAAPDHYLCYARQLKKLKKECRTDCSISFMTQMNVMNAWSPAGDLRILSVRNHMTLRSLAAESQAPWIEAREENVLRRARRIAAVSGAVRSDLIRNFGVPKQRVRVIPNFCDAERIRALAASSSAGLSDPALAAFHKDHDILFIHSGRMHVQKGHCHLLRAFRKVLDEYESAGLILLGTGPLEETIKKQVRGLDLSEHVCIPQYRTEPYAVMAAGDVFVLPSLYEGFSNAALEAMALGLPVITAAYPGACELLDPSLTEGNVQDVCFAKYGVLTPAFPVPRHDADPAEMPDAGREEDALARAMLSLAKGPELRAHYKEQSLLRIRDFAPDKILPLWQQFMEDRR